MFTCDFSKKGSLTLSEYLYENLKLAIIDGKFSPKEKLPSKRNLANHLGISVITVANTYERLISEGYIYSIEKSGFFVTELLTFENSHQSKNEKKNNINTKTQIENQPNINFEKSTEEIKLKNPKIDFKTNATNYEKFPFKTWNKITREVFCPMKSYLQNEILQIILESV